MADDFVEEGIEDYKEEDMHFHSSVAHGYYLLMMLPNMFHGKSLQFAQLKILHENSISKAF